MSVLTLYVRKSAGSALIASVAGLLLVSACGADEGVDRNAPLQHQAEVKLAQADTAASGSGADLYSKNCAACHQANGAGIPGVFPAIAGGPIATGDVAAHINIVVNGKAGTAMQAFGEQLSAVDLAAIITYERNGFGNNVGDMVQPADVVAAK